MARHQSKNKGIKSTEYRNLKRQLDRIEKKLNKRKKRKKFGKKNKELRLFAQVLSDLGFKKTKKL